MSGTSELKCCPILWRNTDISGHCEPCSVVFRKIQHQPPLKSAPFHEGIWTTFNIRFLALQSQHPNRHFHQFSNFCRDHGHDQQIDRQTQTERQTDRTYIHKTIHNANPTVRIRAVELGFKKPKKDNLGFFKVFLNLIILFFIYLN